MIFNNEKLIVSLERFAGINYVKFTWKNMWVDLEEVKDAHLRASEVAMENGIEIYVADVSVAKNVLKPDVMEWWGVWALHLESIGISKIITIKKTNSDADKALRNINDQSWQRKSSVNGKITHIDIFDKRDLYQELKL